MTAQGSGADSTAVSVSTLVASGLRSHVVFAAGWVPRYINRPCYIPHQQAYSISWSQLPAFTVLHRLLELQTGCY
ncbi:hypothetical protein K491DRAFT_402278 [Lophiostoma macrostomum CBS 122681]|uniref:Uncharacterized protein n=1 Tax=Lophiostoma macrostomum CBS 122681 TaxID=1314788 RepID=A0A6A6TB97_9PLEO|nr:hypothetical protein K491DRAFT_402278 [Lophiostoma macrostomum CBS 122681]